MRKLKVVLVEDEEIVLRELEETIDWEGLGLEVVGTAKDGIEGENMIKALSPDIVVTDIKLPGKNGLQMIEDDSLEPVIDIAAVPDSLLPPNSLQRQDNAVSNARSDDYRID